MNKTNTRKKVTWSIKMKLHYCGDAEAGYYYATCDSRETAAELVMRFEACMGLTYGIQDYDFDVCRKSANPECRIFTMQDAKEPSDYLVQCINNPVYWTAIPWAKYSNLKRYNLCY